GGDGGRAVGGDRVADRAGRGGRRPDARRVPGREGPLARGGAVVALARRGLGAAPGRARGRDPPRDGRTPLLTPLVRGYVPLRKLDVLGSVHSVLNTAY